MIDMKKIILSLFVINLIGCESLPKENIVPYVLSIEAENSIYKAIKNENKDSIIFYFKQLSIDKFEFDLLKGDKYSFSNRKLYVNDQFYPLIFETDYIFYSKMVDGKPLVLKFNDDTEKKSSQVKIPDIQERLINKSLYSIMRKKNILDMTIFWIVDSKGNLLETNSK
jgi:hypothetical protein